MTVFARILWQEPWAIFFVMTIGLLKEIWDERFGSGFSLLDLAANAVGCMLAVYFTQHLTGSIFDT